jgi:hypothetical protein
MNLHTFAMKMEVACSSETLVSTHNAMQWHNPEDQNLNSLCCENIKTYKSCMVTVFSLLIAWIL